MDNQKTLLSELRLRSAIDCDTLDVEGMFRIGLYTTESPFLLALDSRSSFGTVR